MANPKEMVLSSKKRRIVRCSCIERFKITETGTSSGNLFTCWTNWLYIGQFLFFVFYLLDRQANKQTKSTHHPLPPAPHTCSANRSLILFYFIFLLLLIRSFGYCVPSVWQITASNPRCWSSIVVKYYRLVSSLCHSQQRIVSAGLWPTWVYQICHSLVI